jgi:hypothetical protein
MNQQQVSLNGGEITPFLAHRVDLEKHSTSLAACHNYIPLPYGGARKRPGTLFLTELTDLTGSERMHSFQGSDGARYVLIFSPTEFLAWDIANETLHRQDLDWPITADQLTSLRIVPINDVLYIVSPHFTPLQLSYYGATDWRISALGYRFAPYCTENLIEGRNITVLSSPVASAWVTATSYTVGQIRLSTDGKREYTCTVAHTSNSARQPGVGADWRDYWTPTIYSAGTEVTLRAYVGAAAHTWGVDYQKNDIVTSYGQTWICIKAHSGAPDWTPGAPGSYYADYWTLADPIFFSDHTYASEFRPSATFSINQKRDEQAFQTEILARTANDGKYSPNILIQGDWDFNTFGTVQGTFTLERSTDGTTWTTARICESDGDRNFAIEGTEDVPTLMRVKFTKNGSTGSGGQHRGVLAPRLGTIAGRATISTVSGTSAAAQATEMMISGTTYNWKENAFNRRQGYPAACCLHESRLYFAGTTRQPTTLWGSVIEDWNNFQDDTTADDKGFSRTLTTHYTNRIQWLASQRRLFVGCLFSEWVIGSEYNDNPISALNFLARSYTSYGSADLPPLNIGGAVVFAQRHSNRLRELAYISDSETYDAADLTRLSEHIFHNANNQARITQMAWQESAEPTLWGISNGRLLSFTYIRTERVNAWAQHTTVGNFLAVCVSPTDADDDEVYLITYRPCDSGSPYKLEVIPSNAALKNNEGLGSTTPSAASPVVYDCQVTVTVGTGDTVPAHPAAIGNVLATPTNVAAANTIPEFAPGEGTAGTYIMGNPIEAYVMSLPLEIQTQTGSSIGRKKKMHKIRAHVLKTRNLQAVSETRQTNPLDSPSARWTRQTMTPSQDTFAFNLMQANTDKLYSGWVESNVTISALNLTATLYHNSPTPCIITALVCEYEVTQA